MCRLAWQRTVVLASRAHLHTLPVTEWLQLDVLGIFRQKSYVIVVGTAERQIWSEAVMCSHVFEHWQPMLGRLQRRVVTDEVHATLGPGLSHTAPVQAVQKARLALRITSHQRHDDNLVLVALEVINRLYADFAKAPIFPL